MVEDFSLVIANKKQLVPGNWGGRGRAVFRLGMLDSFQYHLGCLRDELI